MQAAAGPQPPREPISTNRPPCTKDLLPLRGPPQDAQAVLIGISLCPAKDLPQKQTMTVAASFMLQPLTFS